MPFLVSTAAAFLFFSSVTTQAATCSARSVRQTPPLLSDAPITDANDRPTTTGVLSNGCRGSTGWRASKGGLAAIVSNWHVLRAVGDEVVSPDLATHAGAV